MKNRLYIFAIIPNDMTFDEYLQKKKINTVSFKQQEPDLWQGLNEAFVQMHPDSFTSQKLYLINPIRRNHPLPDSVGDVKAPKRMPGKPVIRKVQKPK